MSVASTGASIWERANRAAFSPAETAELLGLSEATIFRLLKRKALSSVLIGGSRRIPATEIQKALTANAA
jgi:excisionase family DNA binding protein